MRITAKVAGAGGNGLTRVPFPEFKSIDEDLCTDGTLDEAKCRRALNHPDEGIQINGGDCLPVFAFATELLKQVRDACQRMIDNRREGNNRDAHDAADCADDRHAERNMNKGKFVFVRTDIGYNAADGVLKLRIDVQNPKGVVGVAERIALDYAYIVARIANHIADELSSMHGNAWKFDFKGGSGRPHIFDEARQIDADLKRRAEAKESNIAMWKCERRTASGHCSPCKFDCPHYKAGMCVEVKE